PDEVLGGRESRFDALEAIRQGDTARAVAIAAAEGRYEEEAWHVRKDGSRFMAHVHLTPLRDAEGGLRGFSKITRDITELKAAESATKQAEDRFRASFDEAPIGSALLDLEGRF